MTEGQKEFVRRVFGYYQNHGRNFPWRRTADPYKILVSEIMLQQTQVGRVLEKYPEFLRRFPNFETLAETPLAEVLRAWQGLGYNRRALYLKRTAELVVKKYQGKLPADPEVLRALPGIGPATAGAVLAFAFGKSAPFIETNIRRVCIHFFFSRRKRVSDQEVLRLVEKTMDQRNPREWYYALMDYGAMLAKKADENPNRRSRRYRTQPSFSGSQRQLRGRIIKKLLAGGLLTVWELKKELAQPLPRLAKTLAVLEKEGFLNHEAGVIRLASQ